MLDKIRAILALRHSKGTAETAEVPAEPEIKSPLDTAPPKATRLSRTVVLGVTAVAAAMFIIVLYKLITPPNKAEQGAEDSSKVEKAGDLPKDLSSVRVFKQEKPPAAPPSAVYGGVETAEGIPEDKTLTAAMRSDIFVTKPRAKDEKAEADKAQATPEEMAEITKQQQAQKEIMQVSLNHEQIPYDGVPVIHQGAVLPAVLQTGLNTDLPGYATAKITENVYDSVTGKHLLVPQGAKLFGIYNSEQAFEQERVYLVWSRLILPDGSWILLDDMPMTDQEGYSGVKDIVDNHWGSLLLGAVLTTVFETAQDILPELVEDDSNSGNQVDISPGIQSGSTNMADIFQDYADRHMSKQPTLIIRPGFRINVMVHKDIRLKPYGTQTVKDGEEAITKYEKPHETPRQRPAKQENIWLN